MRRKTSIHTATNKLPQILPRPPNKDVAPSVGRLQADGRDFWSPMKAYVLVQQKGPQLLAASIKSKA